MKRLIVTPLLLSSYTAIILLLATPVMASYWQFLERPPGFEVKPSPRYSSAGECEAAFKIVDQRLKKAYPGRYPLIGSCEEIQASAKDTTPQPAIVAALPAVAAGSSRAVSLPKAKPIHSFSKRYFVEFRARAADSYGHLYVLFGELNGRSEIVKSEIAGLHPAGDANDCANCSIISWTLGHFIFVPAEIGASDGDLEEKYVTARYRVIVDEATFNKVSAYISEQKKAEQLTWHALWKNCILFGNGIAKILDLKTPDFLLLKPEAYVESLRALNVGEPQGPLRFAAQAR